MGLVLANRVKETTNSSGTGNVTLNGAVAGFQSFAHGVGVGNQTKYCISDNTNHIWEVGQGTVITPFTFSRDSIEESSNGGAPINLLGATVDIFVTISASQVPIFDGNEAGEILANDGHNLLWANVASIVNSSGSFFSNAHGTVQVGDIFYIGTTTGKLVKFSDPSDLSNHQIQDLLSNHFSIVASMCYDSNANKIYATVSSTNGSFTFGIIQIDPSNISSFSLVYSTNSIVGGDYPSICTDTVNVYGTSFSSPAKFFKIRISDWTLQSSVSWSGVNQGHSVQIDTNNNVFYATNSDASALFAKVNLSDLSYQQLDISQFVSFATDDFAFFPDGGQCFIVSESIGHGGAVIDVNAMTAIGFNATPSYGVFYNPNDNQIYNLGLSGFIQTITADLSQVLTWVVNGFKPNEFFGSSDGKLFFTTFGTDGGLIEFKLSNNSQFGASGTFTSADAKTITVTNGLITGIV